MTDEKKRRLRKVAIVAGVLGLLCHLLPAEYRGICTACVKLAALPFGGL